MFNTIIYQPILQTLIFIYQKIAFNDLGLAIIILTLLLRLILFPIFHKGAKNQAQMASIQPEIKKIQQELKNNKEEQAKALMAIYKKHNFNPFSGILMLLVQLPIFFALFKIFSKEISQSVFNNTFFLGLVDLHKNNLTIALLASILQYWQGKLSIPTVQVTNDKANTSGSMADFGKMMIYIGPAMTLVVLIKLPSALGLYWVVSTIFSVGQQIYINKKLNPQKS